MLSQIREAVGAMGKGKYAWITWDVVRDAVKAIGFVAVLGWKAGIVYQALQTATEKRDAQMMALQRSVNEIKAIVQVNSGRLDRLERGY